MNREPAESLTLLFLEAIFLADLGLKEKPIWFFLRLDNHSCITSVAILTLAATVC